MKCAYCGAEFFGRYKNKKYCSDECYKAVGREYQRKKYKKKTEVKKCQNCGKEFQQEHGSQKYCSDECFKTYVKNKRESENGKVINMPPKLLNGERPMTPALKSFIIKFATLLNGGV